MRKLLIADSSSVFTDALVAALQGQFQILTCADGQLLTELLSDYRPDVLILNLLLPHVDGITALQTSEYHPPVILAIAMHMSAYVEHTVANLGIDYTMIAPSVESVTRQLHNLLDRYRAPADPMDLQAKAVHYLHLLNIPTHLDGYRQLCLALPMFAENPQQLLTKELYPAVARLCSCKDGRSVEHSMRKAIHAAWRHRDNAIWRKYFSIAPRDSVTCPTNKEFICRLAELLIAPVEIL